MGVARLSVVDLVSGDQPIVTESGNAIVMNGEIYNYKDLRRQLILRGHRFSTTTDTEVVLRGYEAWGLEVFPKLNGMFALSIFDAARRKAVLARDRLGKKPLYLRKDAKGAPVSFASEIKALLADPTLDKRPEIDRQSVLFYLGFRYVPGPSTMWTGISKVEPGEILEFDLDSDACKSGLFWCIPTGGPTADRESLGSSQFDQIFLDSVRVRVESSDVPMAVLLSGGVDSACVAAAAVEVGAADTKCFSVKFDDPASVDETSKAAIVAKHLNLGLEIEYLTRDRFLNFLPAYATLSDEPLADLSAIPMNFLCRRVASEFKVALTGEGADEVLAGYDFNSQLRRLFVARFASDLADLINSAFGSRFDPFGGRGRPSRGAVDLPRSLGMHISQDWRSSEIDLLWKGGPGMLSAEEFLDRSYSKFDGERDLGLMMRVYLRDWLVEDLLMKSDKMSMANSLELRCPFLDFRLVEWALSLEPHQLVGRFPHRDTKKPLREFARARLPVEIVTQQKFGFPVPCYRWDDNQFWKWAEDQIRNQVRLAELIDVDFALNFLRSGRGPSEYRMRLAWNLLILAQWFEAWT